MNKPCDGFSIACALMPEGSYWGDEVTPELVLHIRAQARAELIAELKPVAWHVHGRRGKRTYVLIPFDSEAAAKEEACKLHDATIIPLAIIPDTKE